MLILTQVSRRLTKELELDNFLRILRRYFGRLHETVSKFSGWRIYYDTF